MKIDEETEKKVRELQILEQNSQSFLMQKQSFEIELNEVLNALEEIKNSSDEIYKIVGEVMIRSNKEKISAELEEKKRILDLRIKSIEKQEKLIESKLETLRKEINDSVKS